MQECIHDVKVWMSSHKLKLNDDKTKAMIVSSQRMSTPLPMPDSLAIGISNVIYQNSRCDTRYTFDHGKKKKQVINLVRTANFELRRINSIRHYISIEATHKLLLAFVMSRLDYCNSLFYGCPTYLINRRQKAQNNAARLILKVHKTDHILCNIYKLYTGFQ